MPTMVAALVAALVFSPSAFAQVHHAVGPTDEVWRYCKFYVDDDGTGSVPGVSYDKPTPDLAGAIATACYRINHKLCAGANVLVFPGSYILQSDLVIDCPLLTVRALSREYDHPEILVSAPESIFVGPTGASRASPLEGINLEGLDLTVPGGALVVDQVRGLRLVDSTYSGQVLTVDDSANVSIVQSNVTGGLAIQGSHGIRISDTSISRTGTDPTVSISDCGDAVLSGNDIRYSGTGVFLETTASPAATAGAIDLIANLIKPADGATEGALQALQIDVNAAEPPDGSAIHFVSNRISSSDVAATVSLATLCGSPTVKLLANTFELRDIGVDLAIADLSGTCSGAADASVLLHNNLFLTSESGTATSVTASVGVISSGAVDCSRNGRTTSFAAETATVASQCLVTGTLADWWLGAPTWNSDLRLAPGTSALDAGRLLVGGARAMPYVDADGDSRKPTDGTPPSLGAFEHSY